MMTGFGSKLTAAQQAFAVAKAMQTDVDSILGHPHLESFGWEQYRDSHYSDFSGLPPQEQQRIRSAYFAGWNESFKEHGSIRAAGAIRRRP